MAAACDSGITHFDTAPSYGEGLAEVDLGNFIQARRSELTVATKVGIYPRARPTAHATEVYCRKALGRVWPGVSRPIVDWSVKRADHSFHQSLRNLRTDRVEFLFLHEPVMGLIRADEFMNWVDRLHRFGAIRAWGIAGEPDVVTEWVRARHPLAQVIQTRDSIHRREADFLAMAGRPFQFTYGYLARRPPDQFADRAEEILSEALVRNSGGTVLVSTTRKERLASLTRIVE